MCTLFWLSTIAWSEITALLVNMLSASEVRPPPPPRMGRRPGHGLRTAPRSAAVTGSLTLRRGPGAAPAAGALGASPCTTTASRRQRQCGARRAAVRAMSFSARGAARSGGSSGGASPSSTAITAAADVAIERRLYPPSSATTTRPPATPRSRCVMWAYPAGDTCMTPSGSPAAASKPAETITRPGPNSRASGMMSRSKAATYSASPYCGDSDASAPAGAHQYCSCTPCRRRTRSRRARRRSRGRSRRRSGGARRRAPTDRPRTCAEEGGEKGR